MRDMRIISDKRGWWIVCEKEDWTDGPFPSYGTAQAARDEIECADAEDAAQQLEK